MSWTTRKRRTPQVPCPQERIGQPDLIEVRVICLDVDNLIADDVVMRRVVADTVPKTYIKGCGNGREY